LQKDFKNEAKSPFRINESSEKWDKRKPTATPWLSVMSDPSEQLASDGAVTGDRLAPAAIG
jgi:hypothetical protein